jgi:fumarate reductase flavoprotein subunit
LRSLLAREARRTVEWMADQGITYQGPYPDPAAPAARVHIVLPNGRAYVAALQARALAAGVEIVVNARAQQLVKREGRVSGDITSQGEFRAGRGVVLATGDFSSSPQLKRRYLGEAAEAVPGINTLATGDGHVMGADAGADLVNMDLAPAEANDPGSASDQRAAPPRSGRRGQVRAAFD